MDTVDKSVDILWMFGEFVRIIHGVSHQAARHIFINGRRPADLVFYPTPAGWGISSRGARPVTLPLSGNPWPGLHLNRAVLSGYLNRLTWVVSPAAGIDLQPQPGRHRR